MPPVATAVPPLVPGRAPDRGRPFGPAFLHLRIAGGLSAGNFAALLFGSFFGIAMMGFINASQPYLFTEVLKVPAAEQGPLAGNLTFIAELVAMLAVSLVGALSDKVGRRPLWAGAFLVLALGYALYPLATTVGELMAYRVVFALGLAANTAMLPAVANDYAVDESRGKVIAIGFLLNGLGFILLLTPLRMLLPVFTALTDGDPVQTARYWLWIAAGTCVLVSVVLQLGLKPGAPAQLGRREPWLLALKVGIRAGCDLRVGFAYLSAVLIGMGEISANLATLTLIGSVAPVKGRGAVIGLFSLSGAIGILLVAKFGGILSGMFGGIAPFVLVAAANFAVMLLAVAVWAATRGRPHDTASAMASRPAAAP